MTPAELYRVVEHNKCDQVKVEDTNHMCIFETQDSTSAAEAIRQLEEYIPMLTGYKNVYVYGKKGKDTTWKNGYTWRLELSADAKAAAGIGAPNNGGISADTYLTTVMGMMEKNNAATLEIMKLQMEAKNKDPMQYMPVVDRVMGMLGFTPPATIAGGETKEATVKLAFSDLGKMTPEEKNAEIKKLWEGLPEKCTADEMLTLLTLLNSEPAKMTTLLTALHKNPSYIDIALNYLPK